MSEKVINLATSSRVIVLGLQLIFNTVIPDHIPDVFKSPWPTAAQIDDSGDIGSASNNGTRPLDSITKFLFGGLLRWDGEYFLHVSEHGYTYENTLAFYPLFPGLVRLITKPIVGAMTFISFRYAALLVSIALNVYFFQRAAKCLYELTLKVFTDPTMAWNAIVLFCFNPASIFFTAPYSECLFCWLSFSLMLECLQRKNVLRASFLLALTMVCRSNGLLNIGFPIYFVVREVLVKRTVWKLGKLLVIIIPSFVPLICFHLYAYKLYCQQTEVPMAPHVASYGHERGYILAGTRNSSEASPWCDSRLPYSYGYVQQHYWNVGLFNYYELKQIPNFLLAMPIIVLMSIKSLQFFTDAQLVFREKGFIGGIRTLKSLHFVIHALFLTLFSVLFVHIQVTTRLLASSSPCLYWFGADYLPKNFEGIRFSLPRIKSRRALIIYWSGGYFVIGTLLFSNFYPWT